MNKGLIFAFFLLAGCKYQPMKITNPTPGGIIVVDQAGNESEFLPMSDEEFEKLQADLESEKLQSDWELEKLKEKYQIEK